jgi:hypothetical protein
MQVRVCLAPFSLGLISFVAAQHLAETLRVPMSDATEHHVRSKQTRNILLASYVTCDHHAAGLEPRIAAKGARFTVPHHQLLRECNQ